MGNFNRANAKATTTPVTVSNRYTERESGFGHRNHNTQATAKPASNATEEGPMTGMLA